MPAMKVRKPFPRVITEIVLTEEGFLVNW